MTSDAVTRSSAPGKPRRIVVLASIGILIIVAAFAVRKHVNASRAAAIKSAAAAQVTQQRVEAEKELVRLLDAARNSPADKQRQWDLANFYMKNRMPDKAADQLAAIVRLDPKDADAQLKLADMCLALEQFPQAEAYYRGITSADPKSLKAWQGYTAALIQQRRFLEATNTGAHAVALDKNDSSSLLLHTTALLRYAQEFPDPLAHAVELKTAENELVKLATAMPDNSEVFYDYGRVEQAMMHKDEAAVYLEKAHKLAPTNAEVTRYLALNYRAMLKDDTAMALLKEALVKDPDSQLLNDQLGVILQDSADPAARQLAVDAFKRASKAAPDDPRICEHLGAALEKTGDLQGARLAYEHATQTDPFRPYSFQKLALVYTRLGETALAKKAADLGRKMTFNKQQLTTIINISAKHPKDVGLHLILADRYREMRMLGASRDEYLRVLALDPHNSRVPREFVPLAAPGFKSGR